MGPNNHISMEVETADGLEAIRRVWYDVKKDKGRGNSEARFDNRNNESRLC